jgi:hypothetical protein
LSVLVFPEMCPSSALMAKFGTMPVTDASLPSVLADYYDSY